METFVWDLEYFANQDNFTGISKDRHNTIWSRLEFPLSVSDAGVSNATSEMSSIRSSIITEVRALLSSVELADDDKWFEIASVFATQEAGSTSLTVVIGGGTNLTLCMQLGTCPESVEIDGSVFTSITVCAPYSGDFRHDDDLILACGRNKLSQTIKFATEAVRIIDNFIDPPTRLPFNCNPIAASQYYQYVQPLNNIAIGPGQVSSNYPNPDSDNTSCTRDYLVYNGSECDTDCGQQDLRCITQSDFSGYLLPKADEVIAADRALLGANAKFFSYSIYGDFVPVQCGIHSSRGPLYTYSIVLESQYVYE